MTVTHSCVYQHSSDHLRSSSSGCHLPFRIAYSCGIYPLTVGARESRRPWTRARPPDGRPGRRLPIARFLQFDQPGAGCCERLSGADPERVPNRRTAGRRPSTRARPWEAVSAVLGGERPPPPPAPSPDLRCGAVFARPVHLVGALARPLAAGASAVPGGAELVGHLRP